MGSILLVSTGGFSGIIAKYLTPILLTNHFPSAFPYGIFTENILSCLLIGIVLGLGQRFFLAIGFCGGFTTFSSFNLENTNFLQNFNYPTFTNEVISSFTVGLLALFGRITLIKIEL